jgi:hypothetical protein
LSELNEIQAFDEFNQKLIFTPSRIADEIRGAVNNGAGYAIGANKIVVDDFDATESQGIEIGDYLTIGNHAGAIDLLAGYGVEDKEFIVDGFDEAESDAIEIGDMVSFDTETTLHRIVTVSKTAGLVTGIKTLTPCGVILADGDAVLIYKNQPYRIEHIERTDNEITTLGIYPALKEAIADAEVILVGGEHIKLDLGQIGEEATKLAGSMGGSEQKNATGVIVDGRAWYDSLKFSAPIITISRENFILLVPGAFITIDSAEAGEYQLGVKGGIFKRLRGKLAVRALEDDENVYKTLIIPLATVKLPSFETGGRDKYLSFPLEFDAGPDASNRLFYIGKEDAAW